MMCQSAQPSRHRRFDDISCTNRIWSKAAIIVSPPRPMHRGKRDAAGGSINKADQRGIRIAADHHCEAPSYIGRNAGNRHLGEMPCPVTLRINTGDGSAPPPVTALVVDETDTQRLIRRRLQPGVISDWYS